MKFAESNLNTLASLWAPSQRQPDVSGFKASSVHSVSRGVYGEVGVKHDLLIYLHLLPHSFIQKQLKKRYDTYEPAPSPACWDKKTYIPLTILTAMLS